MPFEALLRRIRGSSGAVWEMLDAMNAGVWIVDPALDTHYVNAHLAALLGRTSEEMLGRSLLSFVPAESHDTVRAHFDATSRNVLPVELRLRHKDGSVLTVTAASSALPADGGAQPCVACVVTDITARKRAEDALRRSASYYRVLTGAAQDHIFVIDDEDRVEYVNQAAAEQLRTTPDRVIGRLRTQIFPPDVAERQGANLRQVLATGQPLYAEGRTTYLDREVWLSTWLAPIVDETGKAAAVLGLSRDMTARKKVEDELRAAEQRLRVVLSHLPIIMWATNRVGVITFCAGQALQTLGIAPEHVVARTFADVGVELFTSLSEHVGRALAGSTFDSQIRVQDLTFDAWSVALRDDTRNVIGATGVIFDTTERRRLETELANAQKMEAIGRLAGGIAHDFNNNLTAIVGYVDMILEQVGTDKPISKDLAEVQHAAMRAAGLVRRLLAFGRRQVVQPRDLDLNGVVEGLRPMLERVIGESIEIRVTLAPDLRTIVGDAAQIEQVIMNLALNARDAMPSGGALIIETANVVRKDDLPVPAAGAYVVLTIRDTGSGMDAPTRDRVFEPFFTTKPVGEGTGLGLSTVYGIVKQLNGFISVDSELGHGSAFHVYLPVPAQTPALIPTLEKAGKAVVGRETILLVEDEDGVRRFAKIALERHGFHVIEAASPDEALSRFEGAGQPIGLLLTDVVMPKMSGPELAEQLKKRRPELPVLYMSGYPANMVMQGATLDATVRLLPKPFTTSDLLSSVEAALRVK